MAFTETSLSRYIRSVNELPRLTREEERALVRRWYDDRDPRARDALLRSHLRYVVALALKYRRYGVPLAELIGEGNVAVLHALLKFDPDRELRFVTYAAYWIRAFMLNAVIRSWSLVGAGSGVLRSRLFFRVRRERARIANLVGEGQAADAQLSATLGIAPDKLHPMLQRLDLRDLSLDMNPREDAPSLLESLPGPENQEADLGAEETRRLLASVVHEALERLDRRERFIVERRLMADRESELSLAEIGRSLGVSRERARQLELRTKHKLRLHVSESPAAHALLPSLAPAV